MVFGIAVGDANGVLVALGDIVTTEGKAGRVEMMEALLNEQNPQNSRRNLLPMKCINRALLMGHEHVSRALVELRQIRKTPSSADRVLHDAPEAFDRIEVMPTMGR